MFSFVVTNTSLGKPSGGLSANVHTNSPSAPATSPNFFAKGPNVSLSGSTSVSGSAGVSVHGKGKGKSQSRQMKLEFQQKAISTGSACSLCRSKFSLTKRPVCEQQ